MDAFIQDLIAYMPQIMTGLRNTVMLMVMMCITGLIGGIFVFYLTSQESKKKKKK
jgi:ABC-type amino acid transport system permease subunit